MRRGTLAEVEDGDEVGSDHQDINDMDSAHRYVGIGLHPIEGGTCDGSAGGNRGFMEERDTDCRSTKPLISQRGARIQAAIVDHGHLIIQDVNLKSGTAGSGV
jgi:hypothetical protein